MSAALALMVNKEPAIKVLAIRADENTFFI
jgi:hypothetical protein